MASAQNKNKRRNQLAGRQRVAVGEIGASGLSRIIFPGVVFMATLLVFSPSLDNGFVSWDDNKTLLDNVHYRGLGWPHLGWMFSTFYLGNYRPLTWMTLGLDYILWGIEPLGYHLTNLFLHAVNAVLFYFIAERLLALAFSISNKPHRLSLRAAAAFSALVFSIHPLRVEAVVWLSARNHLLAGLFYLGTILCYLRAAAYDGTGREYWYWLIAAIVLYGFSLLSQPSGLTLPFVLLVLDVYPLRRLGGSRGKWFGPGVRWVWREKMPFLFLALGGVLLAVLAKQGVGAMQPLARYGFLPRVWQASFGLFFYLWKTIIPLNLSPLYETPAYIDPLALSFIASGAFVLALTAMLIIFRRHWPAGLGVWLWYAALLAPFLGFAQSGPQFVADRYSYLASLGFSLLAGAGIFSLWRLGKAGQDNQAYIFGSAAFCFGILVGLAFLTIEQTGIWHDSERLWGQALRVDPSSSIAHNNMGNVRALQGKTLEAIAHYRRALEIDPNYAEAHFDLATALSSVGQLESAVQQFHAGLRLDPRNAQARYYLGRAYARRGEIEKAIDEFRQSLSLDPGQSTVHYDLGTALVLRGNLNEAIGQFRQVISLRPDYAEAHYSLGRILASQGQLHEAIDEFRETIRVEPQFVEASLSLSQALAEQEKRGRGN